MPPPSVEEERIQRGLSRKEVRDGLLLRVDEIFYRRGRVCFPRFARSPVGWDCTLLAGGLRPGGRRLGGCPAQKKNEKGELICLQ